MAYGFKSGGRAKGTRNKSHKPLIERLMARVSPEPNSGCWLWTGAASANGYGRCAVMCDGGQRGWKVASAHRVMYEAMRGDIPAGLELDHLCRTPLCVNPDHLDPVTHKENMHRSPFASSAPRPHRRKSHCARGHAMAGDNVVTRQDGCRFCRTCGNDRAREYQRAKRARQLPGSDMGSGKAA